MLIDADLTEMTEPIEPGTYKARVMGVEQKKSQKGNPYLNWKNEIFDAEDPVENGKTFYHSTPLTGKGAGIFQNFYKAATGEDLDKGKHEFDTEQIIGKELQFTLAAGVDQNGEPKKWPDVKAVVAI